MIICVFVLLFALTTRDWGCHGEFPAGGDARKSPLSRQIGALFAAADAARHTDETTPAKPILGTDQTVLKSLPVPVEKTWSMPLNIQNINREVASKIFNETIQNYLHASWKIGHKIPIYLTEKHGVYYIRFLRVPEKNKGLVASLNVIGSGTVGRKIRLNAINDTEQAKKMFRLYEHIFRQDGGDIPKWLSQENGYYYITFEKPIDADNA